MANKPAPLDDWIKRTLKEDPPRSKSLIVTIFGDSLAPRISGIWLGELIAILEPFQINERLTRTSAFRLTEEGWLVSQRNGRRSRYSLTPSGLHRVQHAYRRIYDPYPTQWDGNWTLVLSSKATNPPAVRIQLRRELSWEGFGLLDPGIYLHPTADLSALHEVLHRLKLTRDIAVVQARDLATVSRCPAARLAAACWDLKLVANHYRRFLKRFQPALAALCTPVNRKIDPQTAFTVQTLLIHAFRRVVLHDPRLPAALLPDGWPGHAAYHLCRELYLLTHGPAQCYLDNHLGETPRQASHPDHVYRRRFGGLV